jgi:hypothetical protein
MDTGMTHKGIVSCDYVTIRLREAQWHTSKIHAWPLVLRTGPDSIAWTDARAGTGGKSSGREQDDPDDHPALDRVQNDGYLIGMCTRRETVPHRSF